jgi:hypothetical protein
MSQRIALALSSLALLSTSACTAAIGGEESSGPAQGEAPTSEASEVHDDAPVVEPWAFLNDGADLYRGLDKADFSPHFKDGADGSTPDGASLQGWDTPVKGQGSRGWCTAFAAVAAMENLVKHKFGVTADLSEIDHWDHYRVYNITASVKAAANKLIVPETSWPYWGSPIADYRSTAIAKVTAYKNLTSRAQVFDAIRNGHPVVIGLDLTSSWRSPGANGRISSSGSIIGGHAMSVVGFQDDGSWGGGGYLTIKNSWGGKWGDLGYAHMPYDYCVKHDCYFIEISDVEYAGKTDPAPAPAPATEPTADDIDVEAEHDPASPARFKLHLVERKAGALAKVASVVYDTHETFGSYQFTTVKTATDGFVTPFYFKTYAHHWRTNGATVTLASGTVLHLAGAVIDW